MKEIQLNNNTILSIEKYQIGGLSHYMIKLHDSENEVRVLQGQMNQVNEYALTKSSDKYLKNKCQSGGKWVLDDTSKRYCSDETKKGHADCQELKGHIDDAQAVIEYGSKEFEPDDRSIGYGAHDNGSNQSMSTGENLSIFTGDDDSSSSLFD